jgi:hypothetical protein
VHIDNLLAIGSFVYLHKIRKERVGLVCGACEGARMFEVLHKDHEIRALPCARCKGSGKLHTSKTLVVVDVVRAEVLGIRVDVGCVDGHAIFFSSAGATKVLYRMKVGGSDNVYYVKAPGPSLAEAAAVPKHYDNNMLYWLDRKVAKDVADKYNAELQATAGDE